MMAWVSLILVMVFGIGCYRFRKLPLRERKFTLINFIFWILYLIFELVVQPANRENALRLDLLLLMYLSPSIAFVTGLGIWEMYRLLVRRRTF